MARYKRIVQYFWDPEPRNEEGPGSRMWCLGNEYVTPDDDSNKATGPDCTPDIASAPLTTEELPTVCDNPRKSDSTSTSSTTKSTTDHGWPSAFLDDFESRIWITYRSNFPLIPKSKDPNAQANMSIGVRLRSQLVETEGFTSDTGWGCMIRSGQSLLANALSILLLGRGMCGLLVSSWPQLTNEGRMAAGQQDRGGESAPRTLRRPSGCTLFNTSLRQLRRFIMWEVPGRVVRPVGDSSMYSVGVPLAVFSGLLNDLLSCRALSSDCHDTTGLNVYVTSDSSDVYEDRFRQIASNGSDGIQPTLILLGIRLGIDRVTPVYRPSLAAALKMPQSVGIAGSVSSLCIQED